MKNVDKRSSAISILKGFGESKLKQKSLIFVFKEQLTLFSAFFDRFCVIAHGFDSQLVMTCSRRILAKHWLGAQKSRFA